LRGKFLLRSFVFSLLVYFVWVFEWIYSAQRGISKLNGWNDMFLHSDQSEAVVDKPQLLMVP
jgi:hypothetical protein